MISVSQALDQVLRQRPLILEGLSEGIINLSSLARKIQPEVEEQLQRDIKLGALIMALKRFEPGLTIYLSDKIKNVVGTIEDITVRSNLSSFTFQNSDNLSELQAALIKEIATRKSVFYTISQGVFETTIIASDTVRIKLQTIFKNETLISQLDNLSSITLRLPKENKEVPGLYHFIFSRIVWEGINVHEVISTTHEFSVVVKSDDIERAFSALRNLRN